MVLKQIIKKDMGKFLTRYDLIYEIQEGTLKTYEIVRIINYFITKQ